jgi:hypothetical protein
VGLSAWRYPISLNLVEHKTVVVFEDLLVGETFEFAPRINLGRLKYLPQNITIPDTRREGQHAGNSLSKVRGRNTGALPPMQVLTGEPAR